MKHTLQARIGPRAAVAMFPDSGAFQGVYIAWTLGGTVRINAESISQSETDHVARLVQSAVVVVIDFTIQVDKTYRSKHQENKSWQTWESELSVIKCTLKCSHTTAYVISVCQRMIIRPHTQIYVRDTLGIRRVRSSYADIRRCTLLYAEA